MKMMMMILMITTIMIIIIARDFHSYDSSLTQDHPSGQKFFISQNQLLQFSAFTLVSLMGVLRPGSRNGKADHKLQNFLLHSQNGCPTVQWFSILP